MSYLIDIKIVKILFKNISFPGGFLPSLNLIKELTKNNGLNLEKISSYSEDYVKTLSIWRSNFLNSWGDIIPLDLTIILKECGNFTFAIVKQDLRQKILT